jgi:cytosine/adenosine deaminase-related metal-dependent hydrolase
MGDMWITDVALPLAGVDTANIVVREGVVREVGAGVRGTDAAEHVDGSGMAAFPGLINAHYHSGENFNPGLYENLPLDVWFVRSHQVTRTEPMSTEAIYTRTMLGATLMLRRGTTSCVDFLYEAPEITLETLEPVVAAYQDAGMRATILLGVADKPFAESLPLSNGDAAAGREADVPDTDAIMELAAAAVDRRHEPGGLIGIGMGPSAPQRCSEELLQRSIDFCRERGLAWQTHVLETKSQAYTSRHWHGKSFVEQMADRGQLGPGSTLVHTVWLSDRDIELMASTDTPAVHCLLSNLRLGDGIARIPAMREAGMRIALGTDGRGCDETLDMLELAKMTALMHKAGGGDYRRWLTAREALLMCTTAASPIAGHGEALGRIEPGARADLFLVPLDSPALTPLHDPVRQVVFGGPSVATVVVDGQIVVRDGDLPGVDSVELAQRARRHVGDSLAGERSPDGDALEAVVDKMYLDIDTPALEVDSYLRP